VIISDDSISALIYICSFVLNVKIASGFSVKSKYYIFLFH